MVEPYFQVLYSESIRRKLVDLARKAHQAGYGPQFQKALQTLDDNLRRDPRGCGDPYFTLPEMRMDIFAAVQPPLIFRYGVHQEKNLVWVRSVDLFPGYE